MTTDREKTALKLYAFFEARDMDGIFSLLLPDIEWVNAPKEQHSRGYDELRELWTYQWNAAQIKIAPVELTPTPNGLLVKVQEQVLTNDGKLLFEGPVGHAYTFKGDKIARCDIVDV